ncbi:hypothetical protein PR048_032496 [Dryococelus australis]|uniref:Uncharacterized protein n=1 Tax=Dryococelus australis TaxID=614101 RepID=A0ABQ9G576_9NEOP|nr:hypothetical protein PR048_032496 [Dryococelus australis]
MRVKRGEIGAAQEGKGGSNWTSPRKPVDQRHQNSGLNPPRIEPGSPWWNASSLTAQLHPPSPTPPRDIRYRPRGVVDGENTAHQISSSRSIVVLSVPARSCEPTRVIEVIMEQRRNEGTGKREIPEKTDQRHRPARFPHVKIREWSGRGLNPVRIVGRRQLLRSGSEEWSADTQLRHRGSKLDPRSHLRSTQETVAPFEFRWTGYRDEVHFEPPNLAVPKLDPRSAAIIEESEIQNQGTSLAQHFYTGTKIELDPGSELGSFYIGSGKMLVQPGMSRPYLRLGKIRVMQKPSCGACGASRERLLGDLPFPPSLHSGAAPYSPRFTLIGSQAAQISPLTHYFEIKLALAERDPTPGGAEAGMDTYFCRLQN